LLSKVKVFFKRGTFSVMMTRLSLGGIKDDQRYAPSCERFIM
jgi:hypothetical protein